jgi:hypothetical protein
MAKEENETPVEKSHGESKSERKSLEFVCLRDAIEHPIDL